MLRSGSPRRPCSGERRPWSIRSESAAGSYFSLSCSARRAGRWSAALLVLPVVAIGLPPVGPGSEGLTATRAPFAALLGVAVFGLVLAEQVFRRAGEQARWSVKPLCIGLGIFVLFLYMYADALLFGRMGPRLGGTRLRQALLIPFLAVATARNWTIDIALSRGVVFQSATLLATGIYLLIIAAPATTCATSAGPGENDPDRLHFRGARDSRLALSRPERCAPS